MKSQTRIELFDRTAVISLPVRLPRILIPHLVLVGIIAFAWTLDAACVFVGWIGAL